MKNLNLIKRLWTDSHEKQSPQRFARYAAMLIMLLTLSVGQMWASKKVWIDVTNAPSGYTSNMRVQYYNSSSYAHTTPTSYGTINGRTIYSADIPDGATKWEVHRGDDEKGSNDYNWQGELTYSSSNKYNVTGWDKTGSASNVIGMVRGGYIYFDNSVTDWTGNIQFVIGHSSYSRTYEMTQLTGTKIWYVNLTEKDNHEWPDATYYAFIASTDKVSDGSWGSSSLSSKATKYTAAYTSKYNLDNGSTYWCVPSGSSNGSSFSISYKSGYSSIPTNTMTINVRTKVTGGSYGSSFNSPTAVTMQTRYLSNNGTSNTQSATVSTSAKSNTKVDVTTGQVDFSYTALDDDAQWAFDGWGTTNSATSSTSSTYRIDAGSAASKTATTIYAFFTRKPVLTVNCGSNGTSASGSATNNAKTSYTLSATANGGYRFKEWTVGSGSVTFSDNTSATSTATISADATITATFEEIPAGQLEVVAGSNGKVKIDGEGSWTSDSYSYTDITAAGDYNIYAQANDHYHFVNWTKSGDGSIKTDAASGVYTMTANGVATVTANFAETQHNVSVQYKCGSAVIKTATTKSNVGEVTAVSQAAPDIDGYTFSAWTIESGVTKTSGELTDKTLYFKTNSSGTYTITATYTAKACTLVKMSAAKSGSETITGTDAGAMTFDPTTKAYYKDITTTAGPYYFRFTFNGSIKYCSDWSSKDGVDAYTSGKEVGANTSGSKVACDQDVTSWGEKPAMYYPGAQGSKIRVWFDYQNKKVWTTANLNEQYVLRGSKSDETAAGMPGWGTTTSYFDGLASGNTGTIEVTLAAGTAYKFKVYDMFNAAWKGNNLGSGTQTITDNTLYTIGSGDNFVFTSTAAGPYTFTLDKTSGLKVKVKFPSSYTVTFKAESFYNGGATHATSTNGGSVSAVDGNEVSFSSGSKIIGGGTVVITSSKNTGYSFDGFYTNANCTTEVSGDGVSISDNKLTFSSISGDKTAYAKFSEVMTTVNLSATNGKIQYWTGSAWEDAPSSESVGVHTTCSLKVVPDAGYYFSGWTRSETPDFHLNGYAEANTNVTLTGDGAGTSGTLTANFAELDKIYFRNIFDDGAGSVTHWANVYVYFDVAWDTSHDPSWGVWYATGKVCTQMTQIEETDVYWAYVPRAFTSGNLTHVAFSEQAFAANLNFRTGNAAFRSDYNKLLNMFVPHHTKSSTQTYTSGSSYTTNYYSNGYWMKYDTRAGQGAGYYLKKYGGRNSYSLDSVFRATNDDATFIQCRIRVDGTEDSNNKYMIVSAAGLNYITDSTITSLRNTKGVSEDTRTLADNDVYFQVKATSEGFYTFILDQSGDKMKLTVDYPVSPGDYRLKHTYVGRNKANSADSTYITYSDIIKASDAASGATVSMYLSTAGTETLVLQECTSINGTTKLPEWNAGESEGLSGVFTKVGTGGDGVYQFDVTVNTSTNKVTATENIALYDGPFYIKTDCAPGGWANYTQNVMDKNTINPTAFDYYFMKWLDLDTDNNEKKNIKCVIANQYNNAISDTLKSDGIATMVDGEPVLDNDGSVRFSYNSKTNALERAYLTGASNLTLETYAEGYITNYGGSTDQYGRHPGFVDDVVWTYELTVDAKLGAKAGVQATWINKAGTSKNQTLIANTNPIISGTGDGTYTIRILFDFKTNSITSTWKPSGDITDKLSDVDVMLVREGQAASNVITFGTGGSLEPRKLVGSLKFTKTNYWGLVGSWNETTRPKLMFFVSFPFDVKVNDIFGLNGAYGSAYVIRRYAGEKRAEKGFFRGDGTTSFWEDLTLDSVMHAYQGYIVVLDNDYFNSNAYGIWGDKSEQYLYFPSVTPGTIVSDETTIKVPSHECTLTNSWTEGGKTLYHSNTDSHWNLIGVPVFTTITGNSGTAGSIANVLDGSDFHYFYQWNSGTNDFSVGTANGYSFNAMHGYMVQYCGDITFTGSVFTPSSVAARRTPMTENYNIELQVLDNDAEMLNHTYVELRENAHTDFELNEDVYLSPNNRAAEIYSFAGDYDVAANVLPIENQTVQVGLNVHKAGTYTIAMPSNFSGTATLIDTYNNTRTNLAIDDYEVTLPKGACNDRFLLDINIHKVPTAIDGVDGGTLKDGKAHKYIENDQMYILKNGTIYNAQGAKVK